MRTDLSLGLRGSGRDLGECAAMSPELGSAVRRTVVIVLDGSAQISLKHELEPTAAE